MDWSKTKNITNMPKGNYRSIVGYAGESIAIGRALVCGYNLFFKAWRDSKYDAVLDAEGVLFRVEIKQTAVGKGFGVTSGGRSGAQINRAAEKRDRVLSQTDCDFLIGVNSVSGICWIVPIEFISILNKKSFSFDNLAVFKEKWSIFNTKELPLSQEDLRVGFAGRSFSDLAEIAAELGVKSSGQPVVELPPRIRVKVTPKEKIVCEIWKRIFELL